MMLGFFLAVCLAVLSTVRAGNDDVPPDTTLSRSVGKQLQQGFRSMNQTMTSQHDELKGMITSKQQPVPYSLTPSVLSTELQAINIKLLALDAKLGATEAQMKSTQTKLESTQTKLESTQTKLAATEAKQKAAGKVLRSTQATLKTLQSNSKSGSTYVRWGRTSCSNASQLVYSGIAGGSWYAHPGAAANPLCLTLTPQTDGTPAPRFYALLYGGEYQNIPNHLDHDVPCSVCLAPQPTTIMIPTTHTCPNGWTTQYRGYLSAGREVHKAASQYVCLDKDLENASNGHADRNGYLFYLTLTRCGTLPCPPYVHNQVVLCVVCSK